MGMDYERLQRAITKEKVEEGIANEKRETAKNLLNLGVDISIIARATDLTPEEIQSL